MNYYEILEVNEAASVEVIKMAYKALVRKYHPDVYKGDKNESNEYMQRINGAFEVLSDSNKRLEYDNYLSSLRAGGNSYKSAYDDVKQGAPSYRPLTDLLKNKKARYALVMIGIFLVSIILSNSGITINRDMEYEGNRYVGEATLMGVPQGNGKLIYDETSTDGAIYYEGEWENGVKQGQGIQIWVTGDKYEGTWKDDLYYGPGKYSWSDGEFFQGTFVFPEEYIEDHSVEIFISGEGTYTYANGDKWVGKMKDGDYRGKGMYSWSNGDRYIGNYNNGVMNGEGTYIFATGETYKGGFLNNMFTGQGTLTYANGDRYEGLFLDDLKQGYGMYTYANGEGYEGYWANDLPNGDGTGYFKNGDVINGVWKDGYCRGYRIY